MAEHGEMAPDAIEGGVCLHQMGMRTDLHHSFERVENVRKCWQIETGSQTNEQIN